jgi:hypothetical protein
VVQEEFGLAVSTLPVAVARLGPMETAAREVPVLLTMTWAALEAAEGPAEVQTALMEPAPSAGATEATISAEQEVAPVAEISKTARQVPLEVVGVAAE